MTKLGELPQEFLPIALAFKPIRFTIAQVLFAICFAITEVLFPICLAITLVLLAITLILFTFSFPLGFQPTQPRLDLRQHRDRRRIRPRLPKPTQHETAPEDR